LIATALPALYVASAVLADRHVDDPFVMGQSHYQAERGDEVRWVYVRLPVTDPTFRTAALAWAGGFRPEDDLNVEDVAFHFTDSLETARGSGRSTPLATLCLHEDGTPDRWLVGGGDCFGDHVTFSDRVAALGAAVPRDVPRDVARYRVARALCADVPRSEVLHQGLAADSFCGGIDLPQTHRRLEEDYGADRLAEWTVASE
jgi:hypothetical protein